MPYCPKCESEYAEGVLECIECRIPLRPGHRPARAGLDFQDLVVPLGSLACLFLAAALLAIYFMARSGQLPQPAAGVILMTQPTCLVVFYAVGGAISAATFAYWLVSRLLGRRD